MMFLRFQNQRRNEENRRQHQSEARRENNDENCQQFRSRLLANRTTFIVLCVSGFLFFLHGVVFLAVGLQDNIGAFLVIGPLCVIVGILILLLCVEILIFLKKLPVGPESEENNPDSPEKEDEN